MADLLTQQELSNKGRCAHSGQIPGLDADYCRECLTWWVDVEMRQQLLDKRK